MFEFADQQFRFGEVSANMPRTIFGVKTLLTIDRIWEWTGGRG